MTKKRTNTIFPLFYENRWTEVEWLLESLDLAAGFPADVEPFSMIPDGESHQ